MAKPDSKPVSYRLRNEVVWALEELVTAWGCTATGAVERSIIEAHERIQGGARRLTGGRGVEFRPVGGDGGARGTISVEKGSATVNLMTSEMASTSERQTDGHCVHCGQDFELVAGAPPTSTCRGCMVRGHRPGANCLKCAEREHYDKKAATDSGGSATGRTDVDYTAFND